LRKLILVGGGGHARACLDVIRAGGGFDVAGVLERPGYVGGDILGVPVIGTDEDMPALVAKGMCFLITLGQIKSPEPRMRLHGRLRELGAQLPVVVASTAHVSPNATIGMGTIVMHMALIGPGVHIGDNCIVNSRALVEHDTEVGNHSHVATGSILNGNCRIGQGAFIGSGAILRQGVWIGDRSIVGMGSIVHSDVLAD
jgi:sugar O-acyltransferase (sialic acid O-acetyltransferase NeuD family)